MTSHHGRSIAHRSTIGLLAVARSVMDDAIAEDRDPDASPLHLVVDDSGFTPWARGAAAVAIQRSIATLGRAEG